MAYPAVPAPYGLKPVNSVDGKPYAGATRQLGIAIDELTPGTPASPIFYGDVVALGSADAVSGYRVRRVASSYDKVVGVFVGCTFTNPFTKQPTWSQYWPGAGAATDAVAYIVDDPMALFQVAVTQNVEGEEYVMSAVGYAAIGTNKALHLGFGDGTPGAFQEGNTNTGDSYMSASDVSVTGGSGQFSLRVIDVVPASKTASGYPEILVKLNPQAYTVETGVSS